MVDKIWGLELASDNIQNKAKQIWQKLEVVKAINGKNLPTVYDSESECFGANEGDYIFCCNSCPTRNVNDILLEELLHFIAHSNNPETSADFSLEWHKMILNLIHAFLKNQNEDQKRNFQNVLITELGKLL